MLDYHYTVQETQHNLPPQLHNSLLLPDRIHCAKCSTVLLPSKTNVLGLKSTIKFHPHAYLILTTSRGAMMKRVMTTNYHIHRRPTSSRRSRNKVLDPLQSRLESHVVFHWKRRWTRGVKWGQIEDGGLLHMRKGSIISDISSRHSKVQWSL